MELTGTICAILKASPPSDAGAVAEALKPYRPILVDYVRGQGHPAETLEEPVNQALRTMANAAFVSSVDPSTVRFRPLLHALLLQAII